MYPLASISFLFLSLCSLASFRSACSIRDPGGARNTCSRASSCRCPSCLLIPAFPPPPSLSLAAFLLWSRCFRFFFFIRFFILFFFCRSSPLLSSSSALPLSLLLASSIMPGISSSSSGSSATRIAGSVPFILRWSSSLTLATGTLYRLSLSFSNRRMVLPSFVISLTPPPVIILAPFSSSFPSDMRSYANPFITLTSSNLTTPPFPSLTYAVPHSWYSNLSPDAVSTHP